MFNYVNYAFDICSWPSWKNISKTFNVKQSSYGFLFDIDIIMKQLW